MAITTLIDSTKLPNRTMDQPTFDAAMAYLMATLPAWGAEVNAQVASINASSAGSAYAIPYKFTTTTTDADPGPGFLRLDNATQNLATTLRLDLLGSNNADYTALLDTFDASTSVVKGTIRLVKMGDSTKFIVFNVSARATPAGYRNITVAAVASSAASPFAINDDVMLFFQRNGDVGPAGTLLRRVAAIASNTAPSPALATTDLYAITALAGSCTLGVPTGTPADGQGLMYRIKDNGTAQTIAYNAIYRASVELPFPATTTVGKWLYLGFIYNATDTKWDLVAAISSM